LLVRTDHDRLRGILNIEGSSKPRWARCRLRLSESEFAVAYEPGMTYIMVNSISRLEPRGSDDTALDDAVPGFAVWANTVRVLDAASYLGGPTVRDINCRGMLLTQAAKRSCQETVKALNARRDILFFEDPNGIFCRRAPPQGAHQVVVPASLHRPVFILKNDATLSGNRKESRMYAAMRR